MAIVARRTHGNSLDTIERRRVPQARVVSLGPGVA
jgi:hypothetical protein